MAQRDPKGDVRLFCVLEMFCGRREQNFVAQSSWKKSFLLTNYFSHIFKGDGMFRIVPEVIYFLVIRLKSSFVPFQTFFFVLFCDLHSSNSEA